MQDFDNPLAFAEHLLLVEVAIKVHLHAGLTHVLEVLRKDMREQIGVYQSEAGKYPEWAPLMDSTEERKARGGFPEDAPLEREGDLKRSFKYETEGLEGIVGSTDPTMIYHEFGTRNMHPRPVVGPALYKNRKLVEQIVAEALIVAIAHPKGGGAVTAIEHVDLSKLP